MVPVAPIITGLTLVFKFHIRYIYIERSLYFKIFSLLLLLTENELSLGVGSPYTSTD
jgi:hypothetical protein